MKNRKVELYIETRRNQNAKTRKVFRQFKNIENAKTYVNNLNNYTKVLKGWRFGENGGGREYYRIPLNHKELSSIQASEDNVYYTKWGER